MTGGGAHTLLIFSTRRCGSTALSRALNTCPGVRLCDEPAFERYTEGPDAVVARLREILATFSGIKHVFDPSGYPFEPSRRASIALMERMGPTWIGLNRLVLNYPDQAVIFLRRRDGFQRVISDPDLPALDPELVGWYLTHLPRIEVALRDAVLSNPVLDLYYEDLFDEDVGLETRLEMFSSVRAALGIDSGPHDRLDEAARILAPGPSRAPAGRGAAPSALVRLFEGWSPACRSRSGPGIDEVPEWSDWTDQRTTFDQERIEALLDSCLEAGDSLLHVGLGNSGLAGRFCPRGVRVTGTTIRARELLRARGLRLTGYDSFLLNKYTPAMTRLLPAETFDYVVDNNPSTYACCGPHLADYFWSVRQLLKCGGTWLTDREGLAHTSSTSPEGRGLALEDLRHLAGALGFSCEVLTGWIYALTKQPSPVQAGSSGSSPRP